jgi:hypothetical protein
MCHRAFAQKPLPHQSQCCGGYARIQLLCFLSQQLKTSSKIKWFSLISQILFKTGHPEGTTPVGLLKTQVIIPNKNLHNQF